MDFDHPEINRFLSDPLFAELAVKEDSDPRWKEYEHAHRDHKEAMARARMIVLASRRFPRQELEAGQKDVLWERIENEISGRAGGPGGFSGIRKLWIGWAAAILVLAAGGIAWLAMREGTTPGGPDLAVSSGRLESGFLEKVNTKTGVFPVDLPDGSTVLLARNSRVRYSPADFGENGKREVYLYGEAFFEVVSNPGAPFYVYVNGLTTKVLGTSFNVRAFPGDNHVEVVVKTGRVTVFASGSGFEKKDGPEPEGEIVNPDERIVLDRSSRQLSLDKLERREEEGENAVFVFDDKPVAEVFGELQKSYRIRILFPEDLLKDCKITAALTDETLYEKIRLICLGLNATYKVVDGEIVIESDGCT